MQPGAILWHEWRDTANPYHAGPSLRIGAEGQVEIGGNKVADIPQGEWVHLEVTCALGRLSDGSFTLSITLAGEPPRVFESQPMANTKFRRLEWLGLISLATTDAVFYIDNLKLEQVQE